MKTFSDLYHSRGVIILSVAFMCAVVSFFPVFLFNDLPKYTEDGIYFSRFPGNLMFMRTSLSASLFIVIVPFLDIVCDIPFYIKDALSLKKRIQTVSVICLTDIERLFIILGVGVQSTASFLPHQIDLPTMGIIYSCTNYCSTILVLVPVMVYLNRITTSFTLPVLLGSVSCFVAATLLFSFSFFIHHNVNTYNRVLATAEILLLVAVIITGYGTVKSIFKFVYLKAGTKNARQMCYKWFQNCRNLSDYEWEKIVSNNPEIYDTYVPAFHIVASWIIIAGNLYTGKLPQNSSVIHYDYKNYVIIFAQTILLVMEFRIRKSEMEKGLVSKVIKNLLHLISDSYTYILLYLLRYPYQSDLLHIF